MAGKTKNGPGPKYRAFISYNHGDKKVAQLLQKRLERFVLPRGLRRVRPGLRHDARPLRPLFRDVSEMVAGQDLVSRVGEELGQSEFLLVVCSPKSAKSPWVQKEVEHFLENYPENIIPVVVDGEPRAKDPKKEAFCPALLEDAEVDPEDGVARERLWIDWRGGSRNQRRNLLSIAAGLLGFKSLDDLIQRDAKARRQAMVMRGFALLGVVALMGVVAAGAEVNQAGIRSDVLAQRALEANTDQAFERAARFAMAGLNLREAYGLGDKPSKAETQLRRALQSDRFSPVTLDGHDGTVDSVAYFPDGGRVISASGDGSACIWNARTGVKLTCLAGSASPVRSTAVSADGQMVATGAEDGSIRLWPAAGGEPRVLQDKGQGPVRALAFSPDGKTLAAGAWDSTIQLWMVSGGKKIGELTTAMRQALPVTGEVISLSFSPDGHQLAAAYSNLKPIVWRLEGHYEAKHFDNLSGATAVAFSGDGRFLAIGRNNRTVEVMDASDYSELQRLTGLEDGPTSLSFSPDGKTLATTGGDSSARVFSLYSGKELARVADHQDTVTSVAYAPGGREIATAAGDHSVRLAVELPSKLSHPQSGEGLIQAVTYSPDGKRLAYASETGTIHLADAKTLKDQQVLTAPGRVSAIALSPDGHRLAAAVYAKGRFEPAPIVWDLASGKAAFKPKGKAAGHKGAIRALAFSPDGQWLATGSDDATAFVWNLATGERAARLAGHASGVTALAFSPDGRRLVTGSKDRSARLWDTRSWAAGARLTGHSGAVTSFAFSPDGRTLATGSKDRTVRLWRTATGTELRRLSRSERAVQALAWSRDGREIVVASDVLDLFDVATGDELARLVDPDAGEEDLQASVAISSDDRRIISGWRGGVDVWDLTTTVTPIRKLTASVCGGLLKNRSRFDDFELGTPPVGGLDPDLDRDVCRPQSLWVHWLYALQRLVGI